MFYNVTVANIWDMCYGKMSKNGGFGGRMLGKGWLLLVPG